MRALLIAIVLPVLLAAPAQAFQCPLLIKQLTDQVARLPAGDPRVKKAQPLIEDLERSQRVAGVIEEMLKAMES